MDVTEARLREHQAVPRAAFLGAACLISMQGPAH